MWLTVLLSPAAFLPLVATRSSALVVCTLFMFVSSARFAIFDIAQYACIVGARLTLGIAARVVCAACLPVLFSSLRRGRDLDQVPAVQPQPAS